MSVPAWVVVFAGLILLAAILWLARWYRSRGGEVTHWLAVWKRVEHLHGPQQRLRWGHAMVGADHGAPVLAQVALSTSALFVSPHGTDQIIAYRWDDMADLSDSMETIRFSADATRVLVMFVAPGATSERDMLERTLAMVETAKAAYQSATRPR